MRPLREHRKRRFLSVERLAAQAGVTAKTLSNIERGKQKPTYRSIHGISQALGVDPSEVAEFSAAIDQVNQQEED